MKMKTALPTINTGKLERLFNLDGTPLYKLAKKIGLSQQTLERMLKGEKVGPRILATVAKFYKLNSSDLILKDTKHSNFYNHFEEKETVYLDKIKSFSSLKNNEDYIISRKFADSRNQISHKIYDCEFVSEIDLIYLKNFLKTFSEIGEMTGTSKTRNTDDIDKELEFVKKQLYLDDPIKKLEASGIAVYYGHYYFRAFEELSYYDRENFDDDGNAIAYHYFKPNVKRIEILYFYQFEEFIPADKAKIYPVTGYTEDELVEKYFNAYREIYKIDENEKTEKVKHYINFNSKYTWLNEPSAPELDEVQDSPFDFLHPRYFIYRKPDWVISSDAPLFKGDMKLYNQRVKEERELEKRFKDVTSSFEFKITNDPNSVPKYEGNLEEETILNRKTFEQFLQESEQRLDEIDNLNKKSYEKISQLSEQKEEGEN